MHKLVILIGPLEDRQMLDDVWPDFLHQAELMPGLLRESTSHVDSFLYGTGQYIQMHELFFNSLPEVQAAMASAPGKAAGALLQKMTQGKMDLFIADHKEDDMKNIRKYKTQGDETN
jgi:hypothetical protein